MQTSDYQSSSSSNGFEVRYLILSSEPVERRASARPTFSYHNRYLVKRRVLRRLRQLRRDLSRE